MLRLKDRNRQIPNGLMYYLPQTKWKARSGSFEDISQQLFNHLRANPVVAKQLKVSATIETARELVDFFNAKVCQANGWTDYYSGEGGGPPPKSPARPVSLLGAVAAGANTLSDWFGAGGVPVPHDLAEKRAAQCVDCDQNDKKNPEPYHLSWASYFTQPAAAMIQRYFEKRAQMGLSTSSDEKIQVCKACLCPLQLKVHVPLKHIHDRMPADVKAALDPKCWVLNET